MRPVDRKDVLMFENVLKMLKQVQFRSMEYEEALAVGQTNAWCQSFLKDMKLSIQMAEEKAKIAEAISQAKEVKDGKPENIDPQVSVSEHNQGIPPSSGATSKDRSESGGSESTSETQAGMGSVKTTQSTKNRASNQKAIGK